MDLKKSFTNLISWYGKKGELYTFEICSNHGIELSDSTIDKIAVCGDTILFYYNENTGDCDTFEHFFYDELYIFYNDLLNALIDEDVDMEEEEDEEELTETDIADAKGIINYYNSLNIEKMSVADALAEVVRVADRMSEILEKFAK